MSPAIGHRKFGWKPRRRLFLDRNPLCEDRAHTEGESVVVAALSTAAAVLLAVAGLAKLRTPAPAARMLVRFVPRLGSRRARAIARTAGLIEVGSGIAMLAAGGRIAAAVLAACYLVLTIVAVRLATGPEPTPCGCFGAADGDVGIAHIVLDGCALAAALAAVVRPPGGLAAVFHDGGVNGAVVLAQAVLLAALGYLSITALPALVAARRTLENR
jgi:hypothetical protein